MFGCKKENDTVWIESREYYLEYGETVYPEWWKHGTEVEFKLNIMRFFRDEDIEILEITTHRERWEGDHGPYRERGIVYFKILRKDLPVMQEKFEFKVADW